MDNKKLINLIQNTEFMEKVLESTSENEVIELFSKEDVVLKPEDISFIADAINKAAEKNGDLTEKDLENICGGTFFEYSEEIINTFNEIQKRKEETHIHEK